MMIIFAKATIILVAMINFALATSSYGSGFDNNQYDEYYFDCAYVITVVNHATSGGTLSIKAPSGCKWKVTNASNWISISSGSNGDGNGTVTYLISDYNGTNPQTGTITIAGQTITLSSNSTIEIPTMSEWGMIVFMLLAGLSSIYYMRRGRA